MNEILQEAKDASLNLLPEKSRKIYNNAYRQFMDWRNQKNVTSLSENVFLAYFEELSRKYPSSTLCTFYSMLRSTLNLYHEVEINKHSKLRALLKRKSDGYQKKKSKTFSPEEINKFLNIAPDVVHLATKVALIMGLMGACRACELSTMKLDDIKDLQGGVLITIANTKTKSLRKCPNR